MANPSTTAPAWGQDNLQFPRLLAEIRAVIVFTPEQYAALGESMDLGTTEIDELLERADLAFEKIKGNLPETMTLTDYRGE